MVAEGQPGDAVRASDADRERVAEALRAALGEGRLEIDEFSDRLTQLYETRTYGELRGLLSDLPAEAVEQAVEPAPAEEIRIGRRGTRLERSGVWSVPRRLLVENVAGPVQLDFSAARIAGSVVDVELDVRYGPTTLILPPGATADISEVDVRWSSVRTRVPSDRAPGAVHFRVTGRQVAAPLRVRYPSRFRRR